MTLPVLIGYFPKVTVSQPEDLSGLGVLEVCSVSECRSAGPLDWIQAWRHNGWGYYDTPELAWSVVPTASRADFDLYAYELHPFRVEKGVRVAFAVEGTGVAPIPPDFEVLGHDVVSRGQSDFFECSPLSCNGWAAEVGANAACLVSDLDEATRLALVAEQSACEPGDYYVMTVWRQTVGARLP